VCAFYPERDAQLITRAYACAARLHHDQRRRSGDPYITHPVAVATTIAELGLSAAVVCAALLHDVLEHTPCTAAELRAQFGNEIVDLVTDLTYLDRRRDIDYPAAGSETTPLPSAEVLTLKVADRLHNMRTICHLPPHRQHAKSRQTLLVITPLARSLGMDTIGDELERLASSILYPPPDRMPGLSRRMLAATTLILPRRTRPRWQEEWTAELAVLTTRRARTRFVLQTLRGTPHLATTLRRPHLRRHQT
jgi:GTP pyrophosphokinase